MKNKQTLLNKELTMYFNTIIHDIKHPERIELKPNSKSFQNIKSLHYNQSTETLYIEMKDLMYVLTLADNSEDYLVLHQYEKAVNEVRI